MTATERQRLYRTMHKLARAIRAADSKVARRGAEYARDSERAWSRVSDSTNRVYHIGITGNLKGSGLTSSIAK